MIIIGVGNLGGKLASSFSKDAILFSTAIQDSNNYKGFNVIDISRDGASKKFSAGIEIWEENKEKVKEHLSQFEKENVIIFSSLGGGSGSSSLKYMSEFLVENKNKVLIVGVLPFKKEQLPPLANAVQSINNIIPLLDKVSIMLFDNEKLIKKFSNDWARINRHIITKVDYITNMLNKYNSSNYSPLTMDNSELESVIFSGGVVDFSDSFLEDEEEQIILEYGKLDKSTKNCLIAMFVDNDTSKKKTDSYQNIMTKITEKLSSKVPNARMITGILRGSVNSPRDLDRLYFTITSGMDIDKHLKGIEKIKKTAIKKAEKYTETSKASKMLSSKDSKMLNI